MTHKSTVGRYMILILHKIKMFYSRCKSFEYLNLPKFQFVTDLEN